MKKRRAIILLSLLVAALVAAVAQAGSSPSYAINWDVTARGGSAMASAHYGIQSTNGQTAIGYANSGDYRLGAGYWYGGVARVRPPSMIYLPIIFRNS
jgi:hypothetical protein